MIINCAASRAAVCVDVMLKSAYCNCGCVAFTEKVPMRSESAYKKLKISLEDFRAKMEALRGPNTSASETASESEREKGILEETADEVTGLLSDQGVSTYARYTAVIFTATAAVVTIAASCFVLVR